MCANARVQVVASVVVQVAVTSAMVVDQYPLLVPQARRQTVPVCTQLPLHLLTTREQAGTSTMRVRQWSSPFAMIQQEGTPNTWSGSSYQ